jgi:hypothetical protein
MGGRPSNHPEIALVRHHSGSVDIRVADQLRRRVDVHRLHKCSLTGCQEICARLTEMPGAVGMINRFAGLDRPEPLEEMICR